MFNDSILPRENSRLLYDGMKSTIGSSDIFPTNHVGPDIILPVKVLKGAAILFFSSGPMLAKIDCSKNFSRFSVKRFNKRALKKKENEPTTNPLTKPIGTPSSSPVIGSLRPFSSTRTF
jgi:hypothetical protein